MRINETVTMHAPVAKVWQALTDATVIDHWNTGPAQMDPREGGEFSIYDGSVFGTNTQLKPNQLLRQKWQVDTYPGQVFDVTFTLKRLDEQTTELTVEHEASKAALDDIKKGWSDYYFNPIKQLLEKQADRPRLKLIGKDHITDNVWSFKFKPSEPLTWVGGQYIWVELPHEHPDHEGTRRWFTISSAPYEDFVQITTRVSNSTFKQALSKLPVGGELELLERPDGDFIWHNTPRPLVFIAGGIGITAFHSILKQRVHEGAPIKLTLLYGNRTDGIPFKGLLDNWAKKHPEFKVNYITGTQLSIDGLLKLKPNLRKSLVYISGPEKMVEALGDDLIKKGLPQAQLRLDALPNYTKQNY